MATSVSISILFCLFMLIVNQNLCCFQPNRNGQRNGRVQLLGGGESAGQFRRESRSWRQDAGQAEIADQTTSEQNHAAQRQRCDRCQWKAGLHHELLQEEIRPYSISLYNLYPCYNYTYLEVGDVCVDSKIKCDLLCAANELLCRRIINNLVHLAMTIAVFSCRVWPGHKIC